MVRQLTAIMFTDMVGYTALMQEDERRARLDRDRQREVLAGFARREAAGTTLVFGHDPVLSPAAAALVDDD